MSDSDCYRKCSTCKKPIAYSADYFKCSVSTCNRKATALFFCTVDCWDAHVPDANHRDAWAEKETAPAGPAPEAAPVDKVRKVVAPRTQPIADTSDDELPRDILIVMSKLKNYIKARSGFRTSDGVSDPLSDAVRKLCVASIKSAAQNERNTVLARDVEAAMRGETASE